MSGGSDSSVGRSDGTRLQALIAHAGVASRRAAEAMILDGRVSVNGVIVRELGTKAVPGDAVAVDGKAIAAERRIHYLALNKPPGYICSMSDDRGRPLAADLFNPDIEERVYNIGRLDLESSGLILFTNDGEFAARVGHPSSGLVKVYEVEADGPIDPGFPGRFVEGIVDEGETLKAESARLTGERSCVIGLCEGRNREIRRALAAFSLKALVLRRIAIGPIRLGTLAEGSWRRLSDGEISLLRASRAESVGRPRPTNRAAPRA